MIESFFQSWSLFYISYITGWLIAMSLSLLGVFVVARDQIFISAAVAQAATLGIALGLWLSSVTGLHWLQNDVFLGQAAVLFAVFAALLTVQSRSLLRYSAEALTGWIFLTASSVSILLLSHSPHGLDEIHRLLSSSIIGVTASDMWIFVLFTLVTVILLLKYWQPLLLFTLDPTMAAANGLSIRRWAIIKAIWLGLAVGLSMQATGMLYVFGCLVLPTLVGKNLCREVRSLLWVVPSIALLTSICAFILANYYDYPPAQMTVALLCLEVGIVAVLKTFFGH